VANCEKKSLWKLQIAYFSTSFNVTIDQRETIIQSIQLWQIFSPFIIQGRRSRRDKKFAEDDDDVDQEDQPSQDQENHSSEEGGKRERKSILIHFFF